MICHVNLPDCPIGTGARYVVATKGRKWVHLFYVPTLTAWRVTHAQFAQMRPREVDLKPKKLLRLLRAKKAQWEAFQMKFSAEDADRARETLRALR